MSDLVVTPWGARGFGRRFACALGRGGFSRFKREGDGATPRAALTIKGLLYRSDRMSAPAPWAVPLRLGDLWSDAPDAVDYNQLVRAPYGASHESLRRADPLYDAILITDWNYPQAVPGRGSAIFLHIWRKPRHPTEGCIAFARPDFLWLLPRLAPGCVITLKGG